MDLPSGAKLEIQVAPFAASKALYQVVMEEAKALNLGPNVEIGVALYKDVICLALASKKIDVALEECLKRCLYNGVKITADTFEPESARQDYFIVCFEVMKANLLPFGKSLYAQYKEILDVLKTSRA